MNPDGLRLTGLILLPILAVLVVAIVWLAGYSKGRHDKQRACVAPRET
jgi:hypothetical protein